MANTLKFGNGQWASKEGSVLAYNDENNNFKPLPFDFTRASGATRVNKEGLIEVVGGNEPRIDFSNDANGALLLEPQRTNLITYSEDFSQWNIYYGLGGSMNIQSNYGVSPSGKQDSTKLTFPFASTSLYLPLTTNGTYTSTVYVKGVSGQTIRLGLGQDSVGEGELFTLNGEWQRFENTNTDTDTGYPTINTFGASALELEVWGFQVEQGSYATSYIPTSGAAVTRVADVCNNAGNEQVFNDSEGVLYAEISASISSDFKSLSLSDGSSNGDDNRVLIGFQNSILYVNVRVGNVYQFNENLTMPINDKNKIALKYEANDFSLWVNGNEVKTSGSGSTFSDGTLKKIQFADGRPTTSVFEGNVKDIRVYNTALTDQELIALTS